MTRMKYGGWSVLAVGTPAGCIGGGRRPDREAHVCFFGWLGAIGAVRAGFCAGEAGMASIGR